MDFFKNKFQNLSRLEKWYPTFIFIFIGFCIADLLILSYRHLMIPQQVSIHSKNNQIQIQSVDRNQYNTITSRNIFSLTGEIPDALRLDASEGGQQDEAAPVLSSLPLKLIGTLVHSNPLKSIAAIEVKGKNQSLSYSVKKTIDGMATIEAISRGKVIFRNLSNNLLEYIELKLDSKVTFGSSDSSTSGSGKEIVQEAPNKFSIKRSDLTKYTKDLSSLLMQARAVPALKPGGDIYGFRILEMQPGSVFTQLGLMAMDVITGVNGNPVTSPAQAMEMYQALQTSNEVKLQVERNGKLETMTYNIK